MRRYIALIRSTDISSYQVTFPDLPGCRAVADQMEEATRAAAAALSRHLSVLAESGEPIPCPRSLPEIRADQAAASDLRDAIVTTLPALPPEPPADDDGGRSG